MKKRFKKLISFILIFSLLSNLYIAYADDVITDKSTLNKNITVGTAILDGNTLYYSKAGEGRINFLNIDIGIETSTGLLDLAGDPILISHMAKVGEELIFRYKTVYSATFGVGKYNIDTQNIDLNYGAGKTGEAFGNGSGQNYPVVVVGNTIYSMGASGYSINIFNTSTKAGTTKPVFTETNTQLGGNHTIKSFTAVGNKLYMLTTNAAKYHIVSLDLSNGTYVKEYTFTNTMSNVIVSSNNELIVQEDSNKKIFTYDINTKSLTERLVITDSSASPVSIIYMINDGDNFIGFYGSSSSDSSSGITNYYYPKFLQLELNAAPQTYDVTFNITDGENPINDAVITFNGVTNSSGDYTFSGITDGTFSYEIEKNGYYTFDGELTVDDNKIINITMSPIIPKYNITFNVTNGTSPITDAVITFNGYTNLAGSYTFYYIEAGTYSYEVLKDGFNTITGEMTVDENEIVDIIMTAIPNETGDNEPDTPSNGVYSSLKVKTLSAGEKDVGVSIKLYKQMLEKVDSTTKNKTLSLINSFINSITDINNFKLNLHIGTNKI